MSKVPANIIEYFDPKARQNAQHIVVQIHFYNTFKDGPQAG